MHSNYVREMARDEALKAHWDEVVRKLSNQFADGDTLDLDAIIYLIGVQELGQLDRKYKKDHKLDLMHIAICIGLTFLSSLRCVSTMKLLPNKRMQSDFGELALPSAADAKR